MQFWAARNSGLREFCKDAARNGDLYMYENGKLIYVCNSMYEPKKKSWLARIIQWLRNKEK